MKLFNQIHRINLMHSLIKQRRTGTPEELARRLDLSVSRVARIIESLKARGAPIRYDRQHLTYYYSKPYKIQISVEFEPLDTQEIKDIDGGSKKIPTFLPNAFFVHWAKPSLCC